MKNKGQALVEFIIIMPVIIFILMAVVDFSNIGITKSKLENMTNDIGSMYKNNETKEEINNYINKNDKDIKLELNTNEKYTNIKLSKKYNVITPGLEKLVKTNIVVEREIYYEK